MYHINDLVIYGNIGVCKVENIGVPNISGIDKNKQYYILTPIYSNGSVIYTPVENPKVSMRRIITTKEADELIESILSIPTIKADNEKSLEQQYRNSISSQDCAELIKVIKTVYLKEQNKLIEKKKISQVDERYMKQAEDLLYSELAIVLDMPKEKMKTYVELRTI